ADFNELEKLVLEESLYVIADEVYEHLVFEPHKMVSILQYPRIAHKAIAIYSLGKMFQCTGWKVGYLIAHPSLMTYILSIHQYVNFSVNTPAQWACAQYLNSAYTKYDKLLQTKRD